VRAVLGEYYPRSFWYGPSEARCLQERLRAIFSQYGPELVRVNKKFIIWLCPTLNYMKSEPWRIGINEKVYQKALNIKSPSSLISNKRNIPHRKKVKPFFKNTVFFHLPSNHSPRNFSRFSSWALASLIMPVGITGKSGPEY